uniref:Uncharacterized protein n=1 Tax=Rhizophora mucronata TaxID=61149 RepID=A0A2P2N3C4_RHIMU
MVKYKMEKLNTTAKQIIPTTQGPHQCMVVIQNQSCTQIDN